MKSGKPNICVLSGNALKIVAAVSMLIDHIGVILFPDVTVLRIIGRLAFPIYAFMIAEGCRYTKNKERYFFGIFALAAACQVVYYATYRSLYMSILVTFSLSILVIYALQGVKEAFAGRCKTCFKKGMSLVVFLLSIAMVYILNILFEIDYGFWGCMTPVFASFFSWNGYSDKPRKSLDCNLVRVLMLGLCLVILSQEIGGIQIYSLFAIPLLLLYSEKRGRLKMKMFFYIFYPAHLIVLSAIDMIIK